MGGAARHIFPGLAEATARAGTSFDPFTVLRERANGVEDPGGARLLLVPCTRPAHAVAAMGADCGELLGTVAAIVLASWEERFGAVVTALAPGSTTLVLEAPPTNLEHALRVAAEHYGLVLGGDAGRPGALVERAYDLVDERIWLIWWYA